MKIGSTTQKQRVYPLLTVCKIILLLITNKLKMRDAFKAITFSSPRLPGKLPRNSRCAYLRLFIIDLALSYSLNS